MSGSSHPVALSPEAAGPRDGHVRQERGASRKAAAVGGRDDVIEGARQEHRGRPTHPARPGAAQVERGVPGGQEAGRGRLRVLRTTLSRRQSLPLRVGVTLRHRGVLAPRLWLQVGNLGVILHLRMWLVLGLTLTLSGRLHGVRSHFLDIWRG